LRVRFPDSEIRGSEGARPYSRLIAACYVLHRLCAPRHPPDALALTLDRSAFVPCPEKRPALRGIACAMRLRMTLFPRWYYAIRLSVLWINRLCVRLTPPSHVKDFGSGQLSEAKLCFCRNLKSSWLARCSSRQAARASPFGLCRAVFAPLRERRLVEPIGIEPTTSSLQSSRSPN
jgi:hypothetical protein